MGLLYTAQVRLNWKLPWLAMLTLPAVLGAGCSGVNAGGSVSPALFFMPGAMVDPPPMAPAPVAAATPFILFVQA